MDFDDTTAPEEIHSSVDEARKAEEKARKERIKEEEKIKQHAKEEAKIVKQAVKDSLEVRDQLYQF